MYADYGTKLQRLLTGYKLQQKYDVHILKEFPIIAQKSV